MGKKRNWDDDKRPDVIDMDVLASMSDDDLLSRFQRLDAGRDSSKNPLDGELEIAYVRREQQLRRLRREAHDAYLSSFRASASEVDVLSDEFDQVEEASI